MHFSFLIRNFYSFYILFKIENSHIFLNFGFENPDFIWYKNRKWIQYSLDSLLQWFRIHPCKKFVSPRNISQFSIRNHQRKSFRAFCVCLFRANRKIYNFSKWYFKRLTSLEISGEKTWENWENKIPLIKWNLCAKKPCWIKKTVLRFYYWL